MQKFPHGVENLTRTRKLIKEVVGLPTYIGSCLVTIKYTNNSFIIGTIMYLCFIAIYYYVYKYFFPKFDTTGKKNRLALFVVIQTIFWFCIIALF